VECRADAAPAPRGADVDLELTEVRVVLLRHPEVRATDDLTVRDGGEQHPPVVGRRVLHAAAQRVPGADHRVRPVGADRRLLGLPEGAQGPVVVRIDLDDVRHPTTQAEIQRQRHAVSGPDPAC
jgi:hypothetical protein